MQRFASLIRVKPEMRFRYVELHRYPHAEVLATLTRVGIKNYSIFLHGDLLFSYLEFHGPDWAAAQQEIAADPATQAWWRLTDPCQQPLSDAPAGEWWTPMTTVFHLE